MGIVLGKGELDAVELLEAADRYLYAAKAAGRRQAMAGWLGEEPHAVEDAPAPAPVS